jgi:hypothetical protein
LLRGWLALVTGDRASKAKQLEKDIKEAEQIVSFSTTLPVRFCQRGTLCALTPVCFLLFSFKDLTWKREAGLPIAPDNNYRRSKIIEPT